MIKNHIPHCVTQRINEYCKRIENFSPKLAELYRNCYPNTLETATVDAGEGKVFVLTGDIPAMWLRDSTAEVSHYIPMAKEYKEIADIISGTIRMQREYISLDPYANAFKKEPDDRQIHGDLPPNIPIVWERKYEIDSLCYPIRLTYLYWKATEDRSILDDSFISSCKATVDLWITEQHHFEKSPYRFTRPSCGPDSQDTIHNNGMGNPVTYTGMTWSGFRPSDDACRYGYLVASNMFAVVALGYMIEMLKAIGNQDELITKAVKLKEEINRGIKNYAIIKNEKYGKMYACEVNGMGDYFMFDDANVPSLLSAPYLGYCEVNDEIYQNTRRFILSKDNPYYYEGKFAKGVGSPHTPEGYIWHIALSMQGLTSNNNDETIEILRYLEATDGGTGYMHEGFDANNPNIFTRSWFSWSCALFAELVEKAVNENII